jgi:hypothetical protein
MAAPMSDLRRLGFRPVLSDVTTWGSATCRSILYPCIQVVAITEFPRRRECRLPALLTMDCLDQFPFPPAKQDAIQDMTTNAMQPAGFSIHNK